MIFHPLDSQTNPRPVVFIIDANVDHVEVCFEDGWSVRKTGINAECLMFDLEDFAAYSLVKPSQLIMFMGHHNWQVVKYHGRTQRLVYKASVSIYPWSSLGHDPQSLLPFFDALQDLHVNPTSLSTMARNSWLRTLPRKVWIREWGTEGIGKRAFIGGRKESKESPAIYVGAHYLDMPAAYLQAMEAPVPTHLRESTPTWTDHGIAEAIVTVPAGLSWNPLPISLGEGKRGTSFQVYGYGKTRGIWEINELRNAINVGAEVELLRVWRGHLDKPLFERWLSWALDLRRLPGNAGVAAKAMTTRLWSLFAMNYSKHHREIISFADRKGLEKIRTPMPFKPRGNGETTFLAAIISSRVRVRLYNELLLNGAVYCDTDGGILNRERSIDGWREDRIMDRVEIRGPQAFRWHCPVCDRDHRPWHYSIAGFPADDPYCEMLFQYANPSQPWDIGPYSMTVQAGEFHEVRSRFQASKTESTPIEYETV